VTIPDQDILERLQAEAAHLARRYPGGGAARQPVHTVYGGAHLFKAETARRLGDLALAALAENAPDDATLAEAFSLAPELETLFGDVEAGEPRPWQVPGKVLDTAADAGAEIEHVRCLHAGAVEQRRHVAHLVLGEVGRCFAGRLDAKWLCSAGRTIQRRNKLCFTVPCFASAPRRRAGTKDRKS